LETAITLMWVFLVLVLTAWAIGSMRLVGRRFALGSTVALSLLVPVWVTWEIASLPIDVRIASVIVVLLAYCVHPRTRWHGPLVLADFVVVALLLVHVLSDTLNDGFDPIVLLRAYGEWGMVYVAGRLAVQEPGDLNRLLPIVAGVALVLAGWSVVESVAGVNPADYVVGQRFLELGRYNEQRWGLRRAEGPLRHPIYFGALLMLLFPWVLQVATTYAQRQNRRAWWAAPALMVAGVVGSMSRGPALGLGAMGYFLALVRHPRWRRALVVAGVSGAVLLFVGRDTTLRLLHVLSHEQQQSHKPTLVVDGQPVEFTGTTYRLLLWKIYAKPMARAGWLGFGTNRTTGFPPLVPFGANDVATLKRFEFVDNAYILIDLRFGLLGVLCLVALVSSSGVYFLRLSRLPASSISLFCAAMASTFAAFALLLFTVWLPHDFGFLFLWTAGISSGLWASSRRTTALRPSGLGTVTR
jgi:hypothetical protein